MHAMAGSRPDLGQAWELDVPCGSVAAGKTQILNSLAAVEGAGE